MKNLVKQTTTFASTLTILAFSSLASADNESGSDMHAYGTPDPSVEAYSDYAFKRGEWQATMTSINAEGTRRQLQSKAHITAFYHSDGRTVQTCFNAPNFHSTDVRAFDEASGLWRAQFLNARAQRWNNITSRKTDGVLETLVPGGYAGTEAFDVKTVVSVINPDQFVSKVFRRQHGSEAWVQTFELIYNRAENASDGPSC